MRPFAVLLGIVLGSAAALAVSLSMTAVIFLLLGGSYPQRIGLESGSLWMAIAWSAGITAIAALAFSGELRARRWRRGVQLALLAALIAAVWYYRR